MKRILFLIFPLFFLFSCGDNFKKEKDKYPDIPYFPKFKNNDLKLVKVKEIELKLDSTIERRNPNDLETRYFVKDSTLYVITFFADTNNLLNPDGCTNCNLKYTVDLIFIKNDKVQHTQWIDEDFKINFKIDSINNLTIGKRKFYAKSNYYKQDLNSNFKNQFGDDTIFSHYISDELKGYFKPFSDDNVIIDSKNASNGLHFTFKNTPLYLKYYKINYKNKVGFTKVYDAPGPEFIKLNDELYYIKEENRTIDEKIKILKIVIYKIE